MSDTEYNFDKVKQHLTTIDDDNDKIRYLVEVKTDYLQNHDGWNLDPVPFNRKCDLEIKKIMVLKDLKSNESN